MMKRKILLACALCSLAGLAEAHQALPVPTKEQVESQRMETIGFVYFNINTYTNMEWGYDNESPSVFNPTRLGCRQWTRTFKEAGAERCYLYR